MFTTSLIIAEAFEKEHKDVLKAISNLECSADFHQRNFAPMVYSAWKETFLEAFNAMEAALRRPALPFSMPPQEDSETKQKRIIKLLRGFISYWAFVEKIPLAIAEFVVCARFEVARLEDLILWEQQSEAINYVTFLMNHPTYGEGGEKASEQETLLRNVLTACSQFAHTRDWDMEGSFESLSGIAVHEISSLSVHDTEKMLSLAGRLLHRVFQRTQDWNHLLDTLKGED